MKVLGFRDKAAYGVGQFGWAAKDVCFHTFLFFYYVTYTDLTSYLAGIAALLALIADGISDPVIGQISDNFKTGKWGRRHPFMIAATVPFAASLIAIFNPPAALDETSLFLWFLVLAVIVRTFLTLFTVPHMALGAELSSDFEERVSIATFRNLFGYVGGLLIQIIAWFLLIPSVGSNAEKAAGYANVGYLAAALAFFGMVVAIIGTRYRIPCLPTTSAQQQARPWYYAFRDIGEVLKVQSGRIMVGASFLTVTKVGISNTLVVHVNTYFYGFSSEQMGVFMLAVALALLPSAWLARTLTTQYGKRKPLIALILLDAAIIPLVPLAHYYGLTPPSGSTALLLVVCFFIALHQTVYIGSIHVAAGMLPDIIDEAELKTGRRMEGIFNSAMMLIQKVTFGVGTLIAGLTISFADMEDVTDISMMTQEMSFRLILIYGPVAAVIVLGGGFIFSRYRLTRARYNEIRAELDIRHRAPTPK